MTFFKRMIAALIATMLLTTGCLVTALAEDAQTEVVLGITANSAGNRSKLGVLAALDILADGSAHMVSRGEFILAAAKLLKCDSFGYSGTLPYGDVASDKAYYGALGVFYELGVLSSSSSFAPDRTITEAEALKILVSALGNDMEAQSKGGYPAGYLNLAATLGFSGFIDGDGLVSYAELIDLLYKALYVPVVNVIISSNKIEKSPLKETVMQYYHKLYTVNGQVTANKQSGLLSPAGKLSEGFIAIDGIIYRTPDKAQLALKAINDYLGYRIRAFVSMEDEADQIMAYEIADNQTIVLNAKDVDGFSNFKVTTEDKTYSLERGYQIIYNGVAADDCNESDLLFKDGTVILLDTDSNSTYDLVFVWRTEYVLVSTFTVDGSVVTDSNGYKYGKNNLSVLSLNDSDMLYDFVIDVNGEERTATLKALSSYPTLAIWLSRDESYMKVKGFHSTVKGIMDSVSSETVTIGGNEYEYSEYALSTRNWIPAADEITFYLTENGKLLGSSADVKLMKYGYLMQLEQPKNLGGYRAYILEANGEKNVYELADKITVDGIPTSAAAAYSQNQIASYMMIRYSVSGEEKLLRKIDTEANDHLYEKNLDPENSLQIYYTQEMKWYGSNKMLQPYLKVNGAIIFNVPEALKDPTTKQNYSFTESDFYVAGLSSDGYEEKVYVSIYDYKDNGDCGAIVNFTNQNPDTSLIALGNNSPVAVVDKVVTAANAEGDTVRKVTLIRGEKYYTYCFSNLLEKEFNTKRYQINPGDIVRFEAIGDTLANLRVEFEYQNWRMNPDLPTITNNPYAIQDYRDHASYGVGNIVHYYVGNLYNVTNGAVLVRDELNNNVSPVNWTSSIAFRFDKNTNSFRPVPLTELITEVASSKALSNRMVAITRYFYSTNMIVIYD